MSRLVPANHMATRFRIILDRLFGLSMGRNTLQR